MNGPRADARGLTDRHRQHASNADKAESVIPARQLVVVAEAQTELDRYGDAGPAGREPRRNAEFEVLPRMKAAVRLPLARLGSDLERHKRVRPDCSPAQRRAVVDRKFDRDLLFGGEHVIRARVHGIGCPDRYTTAESESQCCREARLVPVLSDRAVRSGIAGVQAVPETDVEPDALDPAVPRVGPDTK